LHDVFGVFFVLGDVLGQAENFALIAADQSFEGGDVAGLGRRDEDGLVFFNDLRGQGVRGGVGFGAGFVLDALMGRLCRRRRVAQVGSRCGAVGLPSLHGCWRECGSSQRGG